MPDKAPQKQRIALQIICEAYPPGCDATRTEFGLQDRRQNLVPGEPQPDGSLRFACSVVVTETGEGQPLDFSGEFVHGTRGARFLYLSVRRREDAGWERRLKIPLQGIRTELIAAREDGSLGGLTARIRGEGSGTVPLLDGGWRRLASE
jgi:hypothetical protein